MDRGVCPGFLAIERVPFSATHYVQARGGCGFVCLHCSGLPSGKLGADTG